MVEEHLKSSILLAVEKLLDRCGALCRWEKVTDVPTGKHSARLIIDLMIYTPRAGWQFTDNRVVLEHDSDDSATVRMCAVEPYYSRAHYEHHVNLFEPDAMIRLMAYLHDAQAFTPDGYDYCKSQLAQLT